MKEFIWVEKYAPERIQDCALPRSVMKVLVGVLNKMDMTNLLFYSSPGTGKSTCAEALCKQIGAEYMWINGSDEGRFLDTVRSKVKTFISNYSMVSVGKAKIVIYDEVDNTPQDVQKMLRGIINEFQDSCRFIFTCNNINAIHDAIISRTSSISFSPNSQEETFFVAKVFFDRCKHILNSENIPYDEKALSKFILKSMDFRKIINEMQSYSMINGEIDMGILNYSTANYSELLEYIVSSKSYKKCREWINKNRVDHRFYSNFAEYFYNHGPKEHIGQAIILFGEYQYRSAFVKDQDLNLSACILQLIKLINSGHGDE